MIEETGTPASTETEETTEETVETPEELKARLAKAEELAENQKRRAEKAEKKAKEARPAEGLATADVLYLAKANIEADDVDEIVEYANKMGVSVKQAHEFYQPILSKRAEERATAAVAATGSSARGVVTVKGEDLLAKAQRTGEVPQDDEGMRKLAEARLSGKR